MGKMALDEVVNGRYRGKMALGESAKGEMVSGRNDDWARWQWEEMVKGKMGMGRDSKWALGESAKGELAKGRNFKWTE